MGNMPRIIQEVAERRSELGHALYKHQSPSLIMAVRSVVNVGTRVVGAATGLPREREQRYGFSEWSLWEGLSIQESWSSKCQRSSQAGGGRVPRAGEGTSGTRNAKEPQVRTESGLQNRLRVQTRNKEGRRKQMSG